MGEENPAILLTTHSLSGARLEKLVALHGCCYAGGRAESAPQDGKGESNKLTLADAGLLAIESPDDHVSELEP